METPFALAGSISTGTLRDIDLIPRFMATLRTLDPATADTFTERAQSELTVIAETGHGDGELVAELIDALDNAAPEGWSFGSHEGDGADFGFWRLDED